MTDQTQAPRAVTGEELSEAEFCQRFVAELMTYFPRYDGTKQELRDYAEQAAPTYFAEPFQREEGPEECARTDFGYWEEG